MTDKTRKMNEEMINKLKDFLDNKIIIDINFEQSKIHNKYFYISMTVREFTCPKNVASADKVENK